MSPNSVFSSKSTKRYKALRRIIKRLDLPESHLFIPGRERAVSDAPERVYLSVWKPHHQSEWQTSKFYFYSMPRKREVEQIVYYMIGE